MSNDANPPAPQPLLKGREVIVAVCGGIAAYKVADVVSTLVQLGAGVTVVLTGEATQFVIDLRVNFFQLYIGGKPDIACHRSIVHTTTICLMGGNFLSRI